MKITVTLKDPDAFYEAVEESVKESLKDSGLDDDEQDALFEKRTQKAWESLSKHVEYQEYVTLEFDTVSRTATVKEN